MYFRDKFSISGISTMHTSWDSMISVRSQRSQLLKAFMTHRTPQHCTHPGHWHGDMSSIPTQFTLPKPSLYACALGKSSLISRRLVHHQELRFAQYNRGPYWQKAGWGVNLHVLHAYIPTSWLRRNSEPFATCMNFRLSVIEEQKNRHAILLSQKKYIHSSLPSSSPCSHFRQNHLQEIHDGCPYEA